MLKNKTVVKILSLLIAIVLWAYVMGEVTPTTTYTLKNLKVNIVNEDILEAEGYAIAGSTDFRVAVTMEGKRSIVKKVRPDDLDVTADVQGYTRGSHYVEVKVEAPDGVKVIDVKDSRIKIKVEGKVSEQKEVTVVLTGNNEDIELKDAAASPGVIEISGAESDVERVRKINAPVSAKDLEKGGGSAEVGLVAVDGSGDQVKEADLSAEKVRVEATVMRTKTVNLKTVIKGGSDKISVDAPGKIKIQGTKEDLDGIKNIKTESIDVSGVKGTAVFALVPVVPEGVKVLTPSDKLIATVKTK